MAENDIVNNIPAENEPEENAAGIPAGAEKIQYPDILTVEPSPHMRTVQTTPVIMRRVMIALTPAALWGVYVFGLRAAAIIIISIISSVFFEWATQKILRRSVTVADFSAALTGLLIGMNLSASVPLWLPVAGAFFGCAWVGGSDFFCIFVSPIRSYLWIINPNRSLRSRH